MRVRTDDSGIQVSNTCRRSWSRPDVYGAYLELTCQSVALCSCVLRCPPRGSYWRHRPLGSGLRLSRNDKRSEGMDQDSRGAR